MRLIFAILTALLFCVACGGPQVRQPPDYSSTYNNAAQSGRQLDRETSE